MIYIMGKWSHVRDVARAAGLGRREFVHLNRPEQLLAVYNGHVVVLATAYSQRDVYRMFQEINRRDCTTWGEDDLREGRVPR